MHVLSYGHKLGFIFFSGYTKNSNDKIKTHQKLTPTNLRDAFFHLLIENGY